MRLVIGFFVTALTIGTSLAVAADAIPQLLIGKWVLDPLKSTFALEPAPAAQLLTHEPWKDGLRITIETLERDGENKKAVVEAKFDGRDYSLGPQKFVAYTQTGKNTFKYVIKVDGKVWRTANGAISQDGKTLILTTIGTNKQGARVKNVTVWNKRQRVI